MFKSVLIATATLAASAAEARSNSYPLNGYNNPTCQLRTQPMAMQSYQPYRMPANNNSFIVPTRQATQAQQARPSTQATQAVPSRQAVQGRNCNLYLARSGYCP